MTLLEMIKNSRRRVVILGTTSLVPEIEQSALQLGRLLLLNADLNLTVLYESDSECFQQSLVLDTPTSMPRKSYVNLVTHRDRGVSGPTRRRKEAVELGLSRGILDAAEEPDERASLAARIAISQQNLRMPFNCVIADDDIWYCFVTNILPTTDDYAKAEKGTFLHKQILDYLDFCTSHARASHYLSKPGEELILLYDRDGFPRSIMPRACFYTTQYKRSSIWGFVFNRKGDLLLHQRSMTTKDGKGLWDKSVGGHVDLRDYSTFRTAQRELIEELYFPEAEFSKYMKAYLKDIPIFGDWNPAKRSEASFKGAFADLDSTDWILFRATDDDGEGLTVDRESSRRIHDDHDNVVVKPSVFMSDVFLFVAPPNCIDDDAQMKNTFALAEKRGAAQSHRLLTLGALRDWIEEERKSGNHLNVFTDDLLHIDMKYRGLLERFAEFVRFIFGDQRQ